jgi:hypothetical protein
VIARALRIALLAAICACASIGEGGAQDCYAPVPLRDVIAELSEIDACGYSGCQGVHYPAGPLDFGVLPMGAPVAAIPAGVSRSLGDCVGRPFGDDGPVGFCAFMLDGMTFVVKGGRVVAKGVDFQEAPNATLPFGLRRGQTPEQALAALRENVVVPFSICEVHAGWRLMQNDVILRNQAGTPLLFSVRFVSDGLEFVSLEDPSALSD